MEAASDFWSEKELQDTAIIRLPRHLLTDGRSRFNETVRFFVGVSGRMGRQIYGPRDESASLTPPF